MTSEGRGQFHKRGQKGLKGLVVEDLGRCRMIFDGDLPTLGGGGSNISEGEVGGQGAAFLIQLVQVNRDKFKEEQ